MILLLALLQIAVAARSVCLTHNMFQSPMCTLCSVGCVRFTQVSDDVMPDTDFYIIGDANFIVSNNIVMVGLENDYGSVDMAESYGCHFHTVTNYSKITIKSSDAWCKELSLMLDSETSMNLDDVHETNLNIEIRKPSNLTVMAEKLDMNGQISLFADLKLYMSGDISIDKVAVNGSSRLLLENPESHVNIASLDFQPGSSFPIVVPIGPGLPVINIDNIAELGDHQFDLLFTTETLESSQMAENMVKSSFALFTFPYEMTLTFQPVLPEYGLFGFTNESNIVVLSVCGNVLEVSFNTSLSEPRTNVICYPAGDLCSDYPMAISDDNIMNVVDMFIPSWTRHLSFVFLDSLPPKLHLNLAQIDETCDVRVSGSMHTVVGIEMPKYTNHEIIFTNITLKFIAHPAYFQGSVSFLDCVIDPDAYKVLHLAGNVVVSFSTFIATDTYLFTWVRSLAIVACTRELHTIRYVQRGVEIVYDTPSYGMAVKLISSESVSIDLTNGSIILETEPQKSDYVKKHGIKFTGSGVVRCSNSYNYSVPELSPLIFDGSIQYEIGNEGRVPKIDAPIGTNFTYTLPLEISHDMYIAVKELKYPIVSESVVFKGNSSIITDNDVSISIARLTVNEGLYVYLPNIDVTKQLTVKRGAMLSPVTSNSSIRVSNEARVSLEWRLFALPQLMVGNRGVVPGEVSLVLDVRDEIFIIPEDYMNAFYNKKHPLVQYFETEELCAEWLERVSFSSISALANGSTSIFEAICTPNSERGYYDLALYLPREIPSATAYPTETATPEIPPPNGIYVITAIVLVFGVITAFIIVINWVLSNKMKLYDLRLTQSRSSGDVCSDHRASEDGIDELAESEVII